MQHEITGEKPSVRAGYSSWAAQWAPAFAGDTVLRPKATIHKPPGFMLLLPFDAIARTGQQMQPSAELSLDRKMTADRNEGKHWHG
jgi:hypothetical protein